MDLSGKAAIVTGGTGAIGLATARLLSSRGASVLIADVADDGKQVAAALGSAGADVVFSRTDVSSEDDVSAMVRLAVDRWQRLDIMVANAGIAGRGVADATELAHWERVLSVDLTGVFLCTKHAVPAMRAGGGGAIVNVASVMGLVGPRGGVPYASAKGGVVNLTRATALDHASDNIRINAVCPGHLQEPTRIGGAAARAVDTRDLVARYPLGRLGRAEDVAYAIAFLASDEAAFITGASLVVDGGFTAQ